MELNMSELSLLQKELFGDANNAISDIKFYPGEAPKAGPEEIAGYIRNALTAAKDGKGRKIDLSTWFRIFGW